MAKGKGEQAVVTDVADGIRRITFPLPLGIDHVHCYALRASDGSWTLVDTGLGLPGPEERWSAVLAALDAPVTRIVITHGHPDHVGDAQPVAELTGATVFQGRLDRKRSEEVWGEPGWHELTGEHLLAHGVPAAEVEEGDRQARAVVEFVHLPRDPEPLEPGALVDGWEAVHLPGHADGHLALMRGGTLIAGDAILRGITPTIGVYPGGSPDPLGEYLASLERIVELAPRLALAGHGPRITDPVGRAREIAEHHRERAEVTERALRDGARSGYEVSLVLWGAELPPMLRRFAVTEALAHLDRLVADGRARREDGARYALA